MSQQNPISIMVVEDDEVDRYILRRKLKSIKIPLTLLEYSNGRDALAYFTSDEFVNTGAICPSFIFVDINMPMMNGFAFAATITSLQEKISGLLATKLYILSSSDNELDIGRSESMEIVQGYITKPPEIEILERILLP